MSNSGDLLKSAIYALRTHKNKETAIGLARQILEKHPNSAEAPKARILLDRYRSCVLSRRQDMALHCND